MKKFLLIALTALLAFPAGAQIKVVGHRGVRHNTPDKPETPYYENTIPALQYCQTLGIYAAEFDVQVTADEKLIVFHGPVVPGLGKDIHKITFAEARAVVLPGGSQMPTLEEYLAEGKKHPETKLICEIKKQPKPQWETLAAEQVIAGRVHHFQRVVCRRDPPDRSEGQGPLPRQRRLHQGPGLPQGQRL